MIRTGGRPDEVLVVDDEPITLDILTGYLRDEGYQVEAAAGGEAAWGLLASPIRNFDLVITDRMMPGVDGMELLQTLTLRHDAPPVIMITAHGDVASARNALKLGAVDFIEKPVAAEELFAAIGEALAIEGAQRRRRQASPRPTRPPRRRWNSTHGWPIPMPAWPHWPWSGRRPRR
jgi:DNA-binding NtrC family response regulator